MKFEVLDKNGNIRICIKNQERMLPTSILLELEEDGYTFLLDEMPWTPSDKTAKKRHR